MKLTELINKLERQARNSFDFRAALFNIAVGDYSERDLGVIRSSLAAIISRSTTGAYSWQASFGGIATQNAYARIANDSLSQADRLVNRIEAVINRQPELYRYYAESLLPNVINQSVAKGQELAASDNNFRFKRWVHSGAGPDDREHHVRMNGVTVAANEDFELPNGVVCKAPHDYSAAGAKEWSNCKCKVVYF